MLSATLSHKIDGSKIVHFPVPNMISRLRFSLATSWFLLSILFGASFASAATQYISDELRVPLRNSPCNSCKIVHRGLKSGLALSVLETQGDWTQIKTPNGTIGWVPNQYLSKQPIARDRLEKYRSQAEKLAAQNRDLKSERATLSKENKTLTAQLGDLNNSANAVNEELSSIRKISADAVNLHEQNRELLTRNKVLQTDIDILTATKEQLEKNQFQRWFMYGGFLVFLGAILSTILPRLKPKGGGYSEWK